MNNLLDNPVYHALLESPLSYGTMNVHYFEKEVSPFVGFNENYKNGFKELNEILPKGRNILFASRTPKKEPNGWKLMHHIPGSQFLYLSKKEQSNEFAELVTLQTEHVRQMIELATLTKPGPFNSRTIEFGHYYGIFCSKQLVSMTGRRLQFKDYIEISAVCTHPNFLGRGYASILLKHEINSILKENKIPFLHVRSDNESAIKIYEKLGFTLNGEMLFYFMKRI